MAASDQTDKALPKQQRHQVSVGDGANGAVKSGDLVKGLDGVGLDSGLVHGNGDGGARVFA